MKKVDKPILFQKTGGHDSKGTVVIRLRADVFVEIEKIANETDLSICDVASRIIREAMPRVKLME